MIRSAKLRDRIFAALAESTNKFGMSMLDFKSSFDATSREICDVMFDLVKKEKIFRFKAGQSQYRYFATARAMKVASDKYASEASQRAKDREAMLREKKRVADAARTIASAAKRREFVKVAVTDESAYKARQELSQPRARTTAHWKPDAPMHIPPGVTVQKCLGFNGDRWGVKVPRNGFVAEWKKLRAA